MKIVFFKVLLIFCTTLFLNFNSVYSLLKNCVTSEEWEKDVTHPKCEIITIFEWYCLAKNEISVQRPRTGPNLIPTQTKLICRAPYPIDINATGFKLKGFTGVFYTRKTEGPNFLNSSTTQYIITVPLVYNLWTPRWYTIFKYDERDISTEFYFYGPSPNDKVLPYDWGNEVRPDTIITPRSRYAILPCVVTNPNDTVILKQIEETETSSHSRIIPIDNTTVRFIPRLGFILDMEVKPEPKGRFSCNANNLRTGKMEVLGFHLKPEDFIAEPSNELMYTFSNKDVVLFCASKNPVHMNGTLNGKRLDESYFKYSTNESLVLVYSATFEAEANSLKPLDSLVITCSNDLQLDLIGRDVAAGAFHTWNFDILDIDSNELLKFEYDDNKVTCSSDSTTVRLFNVDCYNFAQCRTRNEFFETLYVGQCDLRLDVIQCGAPCDGQRSENPNCFTLPKGQIRPRGYLKCEGGPGLSYSTFYIEGYDNKIYTDFDNIPSEALVKINLPKLPVLYVKTNNTFSCTASTFVSNGEYRWMARRPDGSLIEPKVGDVRSIIDYGRTNNDSIWDADILFEEIATEILCFVPVWNSVDAWINVSMPITIKHPTKPVITNKGEEAEFILNDDERNLVCEVEGDPTPNMAWFKDGEPVKLPFETYRVAEGLALAFPPATYDLAGVYECRAWSIGGNDSGEFTVTVYEPPDVTLYIVLGIILLVLLIIILVILYWKLRKAKKSLRNLTDEEVNLFINGDPEALKAAKDSHEMISHMPFNAEYEIPLDKLKFDKEDVLGSGAFGIVYRGRLEEYPHDIAIKTTKPYSELSYFKSLLMELKVMGYLGHHTNIVNLIGAYTGNIKERVVYMVVELSPYGNLEDFLRHNQKKFQNLIQGDKICVTRSMIQDLYANLNREYTNLLTDSDCAFSTAELVEWSSQIANGMTHLEEKKVVHADLACRNILLYDNNVVKITDFGLSRQLYAYTNYMKKQQEPLPWRWMAIESLREMNFSTQSDVWGYGVTLWELFSLGAVPYPGLSWSLDFVEKLSSGLRLTKPFYCTTEIYEIIINCWYHDPQQRPTFHQLVNKFDSIKHRMRSPDKR